MWGKGGLKVGVVLLLMWFSFAVGSASNKTAVESQKIEGAVKGAESSITPSPILTPSPTPTPAINPIVTPKPSAVSIPAPSASPTTSSGLSNDNYYENSQGNEVHSPAYSNTPPKGATAVCGDGTYSFSQNHKGTCSHHGGVAQWL